jgi:hypothetical protein
VSSVTGAGTFDGYWEVMLVAGVDERSDVLLPAGLVKIGSEKPTALVGKERVDAHDVSALQVV